MGGQLIKLLTRTDYPASPGQNISLRLQEDKLRWFDGQGVRVDADSLALMA